MRNLSKVIWEEGMHLAQHHFQAQSRYFEDSIAFALSQLFFKPYGLAGYGFDAEALRNGTVALVHARGVMPDGLAFHFPDADPLPAPREIRDIFSPTQESHTVFLAIPPYRAGQANCSLAPNAANGSARYVAEQSSIADELTGRDEKPVNLARKNFRLLLDVELRDDSVAMAVARIRRDGAGAFIYDPSYIPPLLQVGGSDALMELLRRVIEILDAKSETLAGQRRGDPSPAAGGGGGPRDVATFWLTHTIHSSLAPLRHLLEQKRSRPEQAYAELARLAGALCTFSLTSHPRTLPTYDHDHLDGCFNALEQHIRSHLELVVPTNCISIPLSRSRKLLHTGKVTDQRCFGPARWVLGVRSRAKAADLMREVPALVKVCAGQHIVRLVSSGLPGLALEHLAAPPAAIPRDPQNQYFSIARTGPCWDAMASTGEVGVYAPETLADAEFELHVVLESART